MEQPTFIAQPIVEHYLQYFSPTLVALKDANPEKVSSRSLDSIQPRPNYGACYVVDVIVGNAMINDQPVKLKSEPRNPTGIVFFNGRLISRGDGDWQQAYDWYEVNRLRALGLKEEDCLIKIGEGYYPFDPERDCLMPAKT